jgi:beta-alanine--pyruvate transaminase
MPRLDAPTSSWLDATDLDAYWLPFTANRAFKRRPRLVEWAEGMHYYTSDGRKLLDAMSGLWCCNAGHCRKPIVEAIVHQAGRLDYAPAFQMGHAPAFKLASRLAALAPGDLNRVFFCNSGSEAVDTALKLALAYHKLSGASTRTRFIGRERAYHGSCFGGTSVGGSSSRCATSTGCPRPIFASARPMRAASPHGAAILQMIFPVSSRWMAQRRSPLSLSSR